MGIQQPIQIRDFLLATGTSPTESQIKEAAKQAESADKVIVTTYTANTNDDQQQLVEQLEDTGVPVVVAALGNPYDLQAFPDVKAYLNTYSYLDVSVQALANVISGDTNPFGTLPVTIPDSYEKGHGLDYIDTPRDADGVKSLAVDLAMEGEIPDTVLHDLTVHLTAVGHYEQKEATDKVLKHLKGFKTMLDLRIEDNTISHKAYSYLETETEKWIEELKHIQE